MYDMNQNKKTAQELFIHRKKTEQLFTRLIRILILAGFFIFWEVAADLRWIDSFIFSSPHEILLTIYQMTLYQSLLTHIGITMTETLVSFILVVLCSIFFAVVLWLFPKFSSVFEPYLVVLNSLPKSAMAPLLIVWLGSGMTTIIIAGMSVAIFGSILNLYSGFLEVDPEKIKLVRTLGGTRKDILSKVILPASIPCLLSNLKVNIGLCLIGVIIGEFIGAKEGLGYLIIYGSQVFR